MTNMTTTWGQALAAWSQARPQLLEALDAAPSSTEAQEALEAAAALEERLRALSAALEASGAIPSADLVPLAKAAEISGVDRYALAGLARDGRIEGAVKLGEGRTAGWMVPRSWAQAKARVRRKTPHGSKRRRVLALLASSEELGNAEIAKRAGCSPSYVTQLRRNLAS